jgi:outer membrane lipoprotein-sorting protein
MLTRSSVLLCAAFTLCLATAALAQETPKARPAIKNDPAARALYDRMIKALQDADALYVECRHKWGSATYSANCTYKMWLQKPNQFRVEASRPNGDLTGVLVGDGENLWIYWPHGRPMFHGEDQAKYEQTRNVSYYTQPAPPGQHSILHEVSLLGAGMVTTIVDPSMFHGYTDTLQPYLQAVAKRGQETVGDQTCDVIELSFMDGQRTWELWLSQRDHLPRKLKQVIHVSNDITIEEAWTKVVVNKKTAPDLFAWKPPKAWTPWHPQTPEERILAAGTVAPEFEGALADGKRLKLSDLRGKAVLVIFWRVG